MNKYDPCELRTRWIPESQSITLQGEQRSRDYVLTYDSARNFLINFITSSLLLHTGEFMWNPGVSISTTRWPSSSNSLDARIPWFKVVSRRDPLALLTNYSCNRWSLKVDRTCCLLYRGFSSLETSYHTTRRLTISNAIREIDHVRDKRRKFSNSSRGRAFS